MRRTLIDLIERDIKRDPGDAPTVSVEANCFAQDLAWMPETLEPLVRAPDRAAGRQS
jgi:hypothetical protein